MATIKVKNRSASRVGYSLPDLHVRRVFAAGEIKAIDSHELEVLAYQPGGRYILDNHLQVASEDLHKLGFAEPEREYFLSEDEVKELILRGSLDEFLDCLDFAPLGIIDLIKKFAVSLPIADLNKAEAIKNKTGFDVLKAIENEKAVKEEESKNTNESADAPKRRTESAATTPERKTSESKYKVIS